MKRLGTVAIVAVLAALLWVVPALAKTALNEQELDLITAAGQPEVLIAVTSASFGTNSSSFSATTSNVVTLTLSQTINFVPGTSAQTNLRALALNNVIGENSVANAINIQAGFSANSGSQANTITQSWASTIDVFATPGAAGGSVTCANKIFFGTCGTGGNAGETKRSAISGDEILIGGVVTKLNQNQYNFTPGSTSQSDLAALAVNNIVGQNLAANAMNISSGSLRILAGANQPMDVGFVLIGGITTNQTNTVNQYRGTPGDASGLRK